MYYDSERYVFIGDCEIDTEPYTSSINGEKYLTIYQGNRICTYYLSCGLSWELTADKHSEEISNFCRDILLMDEL
jgi:hypothetical protein